MNLPQLTTAHAAAAARAQQASTLYRAAERLNLPHSRGRAVILASEYGHRAMTLREALRDARSEAGLCYRCGDDRVSWGGMCRDCVGDME